MNNYATKFIGRVVKIQIDRPLGSKHLKHGFVYEVNYGFVSGTSAPDGEEIDAYILGINEPIEKYIGKCIAVIHRTNDDDDKLVVVSDSIDNISDEDIKKFTHFQEQFFTSEIVRS